MRAVRSERTPDQGGKLPSETFCQYPLRLGVNLAKGPVDLQETAGGVLIGAYNHTLRGVYP
jgi:hypothetical protein